MTWERKRFAIGPRDHFLLTTNLSFDMAHRDVLVPLVAGATLHLLDDPSDLGGDRVLAQVQRDAITCLHVVPSLARSWLAVAERERLELPSLRCLLFAGEVLDGLSCRRWRARAEALEHVVNLYGPSETTQIKAYYDVPKVTGVGALPVGAPLPDTQILVTDSAGRPCGAGEPGEISIRTPCRTLGYLNDPATMAARFVANPRSSAGDTIYRTGDWGFVRNDGTLETIGRRDAQRKVNGVAIDPTEIAHLLCTRSDVVDAAVVATPSAPRDLVAAVVARESDLDTHSVVQWLAQRLPNAMLPRRIVCLGRLPLTANGKIDHHTLARILDSDGTDTAEEAMSTYELVLADIWEDVIGVRPRRRSDDFFALGGGPAEAFLLFDRVRKGFGLTVPLRALIRARTLGAMARAAVEAAVAQLDDAELRSLLVAVDADDVGNLHATT